MRLHLNGAFRLEAPDGTDLTPSSVKSCGLLALLAANPGARRSRAWLQARLWSDRGRDQAGASLRQALSQLRRSLLPYGEVLAVNRNVVALDLTRIEVLREGRQVFCDGLDLRDAGFAEWLAQERGQVGAGLVGAGQVALPPQPVPGVVPNLPPAGGPGLIRADVLRAVYVVPNPASTGADRLFEDLFMDCFQRWVGECLTCDVYRRAPDPRAANPIVVQVQAFATAGRSHGLRVTIEEGALRRALWSSGARAIDAQGAPPVDHVHFLALVHETVEALADSLVLRLKRNVATADAAVLARLSLHKIFSMSVAEVAEADLLLQRAFDLDPRAIFLSWRVQLRIIQEMERHGTEGGAAQRRDEIHQLMAKAFALEPTNSMVLAVAANSHLLIDDDVGAGVELARRAVALNPANPFGWDALSIGLMMRGAVKEAHMHQLRAFAISQKSPIRHFWDMGACLTSLATGQLEQARKLAHNAAILVPEFRPPLRYMAALDAAAGDMAGADRAVQRLQALEPDFSLSRMAEDPEYPAAGLRRAGLLKDGKLRDLG